MIKLSSMNQKRSHFLQQICLAISLNQVIQTRGFVFLFIFYFYVYVLYLYLYLYIISMLNDVLYLCLFPLSTSTQHFLLIGLSAPADSLMLPLFAARTHTTLQKNTTANWEGGYHTDTVENVEETLLMFLKAMEVF